MFPNSCYTSDLFTAATAHCCSFAEASFYYTLSVEGIGLVGSDSIIIDALCSSPSVSSKCLCVDVRPSLADLRP